MKKILASLLVIGSLSFVTAGGTLALLTSQESNTGISFVAGTLTLSNVVNSGTACFSYAGPASPGNVNNTCQALFAGTTQNYPGGTPALAKIKIFNNGSVDGSDLSVFMPSCTKVATPGAPTPGGGDPCAAGGALFYVQETDAAFTTPVRCGFPAGAGACTMPADSLNIMFANHSSFAAAVDLGAGPAHGQSRYFVVGMQLPANASNNLQGQAAQFGLTWHITN